MEVGIYIKLLWNNDGPPQFLPAGSHVLWKCQMGLSMKDFFVASGLNIQREMHDVAKRPFFSQDNKECTVCIFKFLKAPSSVSFNVPI